MSGTVTLPKFDRTNIPLMDMHMHTSWTDGRHTSMEMYHQAVSIGLTHILFSEHGRKTSEDWFFRFAQEILALPQSPCKPFVGIETKVIDFDGNLDCTEKMVKACDQVMAVVHRFPGETGIIKGNGDVNPQEAIQIEFELANAALDNPWVDILGHPLGMCYRRFNAIPDDIKMQELIKKASIRKKAFEVNSYYHPDPWKLIQWCMKAGTTISLGSNAHSTQEVGQIISILKGEELPCKPFVCS